MERAKEGRGASRGVQTLTLAGVTYSTTARWCSVGRRYCPSVNTSTPAARMSRMASTTSSSVSPSPSIRDVLVYT